MNYEILASNLYIIKVKLFIRCDSYFKLNSTISFASLISIY